MQTENLVELVEQIFRQKTEGQTLEVKAAAMKRISSFSARLPSHLAVTFSTLASANSLQFPLNLGSNFPALHPAPLQPLGIDTP